MAQISQRLILPLSSKVTELGKYTRKQKLVAIKFKGEYNMQNTDDKFSTNKNKVVLNEKSEEVMLMYDMNRNLF
jgi:hypothetical protein